MRRFACVPAVLAALIGVAVVGRGAPAQANDQLTAQALYEDGKRLMADKKYAQACVKFAESQRLDPGVGTHYALADCYEQAGRLATSWISFLEVVDESNAQNRADRAAVAKKRAAALAPRVARVTISVSDATRTAGLGVKRDGEDVTESQWGTPVPVDPGHHDIVARAPGKRDYTTGVDVSVEGKVYNVDIPKLEDGPSTAPLPSGTATSSTPATATATSPPPPPPPSSGGLGAQKILGIVGLGVGVAGVAVGSVFGLESFSKHSDAGSHCVGMACDATGLQLINDGKNAATLSNVFFIVGGVGLAAGVLLWATAPSSHPTTGIRAVPLIGQRIGGMALEGAW